MFLNNDKKISNVHADEETGLNVNQIPEAEQIQNAADQILDVETCLNVNHIPEAEQIQ